MTNTLNKIMHNGDEYMLPRQKALVITLTSAGWTNNEQTVTATGVTANNSIIISPVPTYISDYTDAKIYCSAQGSNSLTFTCDSTPSNDIDVNVVVLSAEIEGGPTPPTPWQPGANTVLYVPMKTDLLDHGPNSISLTNTNITIGTIGGVNAGYFPPTATQNTLNADLSSYISGQNFTLSTWVYVTEIPSSRGAIASSIQSNKGWCLIIGNDGKIKLQTMGPFTEVVSLTACSTGVWYNIVSTVATSGKYIYINGTLSNNDSASWTPDYSVFYIGADRPSDTAGLQRHMRGYMADVILEDKAWTAQEVSDYFDQTKGDYGIS